MKIAIVDDNESWCFILQQALQQQGYETKTFSDPWRFLQQATQFHLAIVDYCLHTPQYQRSLDGVELIRQLKAQSSFVPVTVLISAYFPDESPEVLQPFCPEADLVLSRPLQVQALLHPIQKLFDSAKSCMSLRSSA
ncbi:response regulator [Leptolyngbya ohadii]|uniref:response regulator n=1 Tax=Leptolyngbya ohadii TaxID=1962290 RepID=UPI000B59E14C|nr:response regulator [Leptolyngbya ohadii]